MGAVAAGGAAALSTGAFRSFEAKRQVHVSIAGDATAYVQLLDSSQYAHYSGDSELYLDFARLNQNAETEFADVFRVRNSGNKPVYVGVGWTVPAIKNVFSLDFPDNGSNKDSGSYGLDATHNRNLIDPNGDYGPRVVGDVQSHLPLVKPGEELGVAMQLNTGESNDPPDGTITIYAVADPELDNGN